MIELQYFTEDDFDLLIDWIDSPEFLLQWGGPNFHFPLNHSQLNQYLINSNTQDSNQFIFKVIYKESSEIIGHISLGQIDKKNESARIGKVLVGKAIRGKGIGFEMVVMVLKIAFEDLNLNRVSLGVFDFNLGAIKCYEKAGFTREGLLRQSRKINNEYWNLCEMSILKSEWIQRKTDIVP
jgi:RimJ/RimL family protein N-acetyltransferase